MKRRFSAAFLLGILLGLGGEAALLSEQASLRFAQILQNDFHVLFFIPSNSSPKQIDDLKKKLIAIPGTQTVSFISQDESLLFLKKEDPSILNALSLLTGNPIDPAFEVSLDPTGLRSFPTWLSSAKTDSSWSDVRYRPSEIQSILRLDLYSRFLKVLLSALLCVTALIGVLGIFMPLITLSKRTSPQIFTLLSLNTKTWGVSLLGVLFGAGFSGFFAFPLAAAISWWSWPSLIPQCLLFISAALAGGALCAW